jgi:hypothetical protein
VGLGGYGDQYASQVVKALLEGFPSVVETAVPLSSALVRAMDYYNQTATVSDLFAQAYLSVRKQDQNGNFNIRAPSRIPFDKGIASLGTVSIFGYPGSDGVAIEIVLVPAASWFEEIQLTFPLSECAIGQTIGPTNDICEVCPDDSYNEVGGDPCLDCPEGAVCNDGLAINAAGYWKDPEESPAQFYKCIQTDACIEGSCADNYEGVLCGTCSEGYARWNEKCIGNNIFD